MRHLFSTPRTSHVAMASHSLAVAPSPALATITRARQRPSGRGCGRHPRAAAGGRWVTAAGAEQPVGKMAEATLIPLGCAANALFPRP
jgi:hypothetical protein